MPEFNHYFFYSWVHTFYLIIGFTDDLALQSNVPSHSLRTTYQICVFHNVQWSRNLSENFNAILHGRIFEHRKQL